MLLNKTTILFKLKVETHSTKNISSKLFWKDRKSSQKLTNSGIQQPLKVKH